jgi:hypothetical protein
MKDLVAMTEDSIYLTCKCGCTIFRIFDLEDGEYYIDVYHGVGNKPLSKRNMKKLRNFILTKEEMLYLVEAVDNRKNHVTIDKIDLDIEDIVMLTVNKDQIKFVFKRDGWTNDADYYFDIFDIITRNKFKKEIYLAGIIMTEDQVAKFGEYLKEFIK